MTLFDLLKVEDIEEDRFYAVEIFGGATGQGSFIPGKLLKWYCKSNNFVPTALLAATPMAKLKEWSTKVKGSYEI